MAAGGTYDAPPRADVTLVLSMSLRLGASVPVHPLLNADYSLWMDPSGTPAQVSPTARLGAMGGRWARPESRDSCRQPRHAPPVMSGWQMLTHISAGRWGPHLGRVCLRSCWAAMARMQPPWQKGSWPLPDASTLLFLQADDSKGLAYPLTSPACL